MKIFNKEIKKRRLWLYLASFAMTLLSFGIMYRLVASNLDALKSIEQTLHIGPILMTFPVFCAGMLLGGLAWGIIMNDLTRYLPIRQHAILWAVTHAARRIPGAIWYVVGRVAWYDRLGISKPVTTFANVLETILQLWSGLIVSLLMIPVVSNIETGQIWLFAIGVVLSAIILHPRIIRLVLHKFGQDQYVDTLSYRRILVWLSAYIPIWGIGGLILFLTIDALTPLPWSLLPVCIGAWSIAGIAGTIIIVLPSGFGLSEATLSLLLSTHVSPGIAVAGAILLRIIMTGYEFLFAGVVFLLRKQLGFPDTNVPQNEK